MTNNALSSIKGGIVVSCQADADSPLRDPAIMAAMARAAVGAGAVGIRARGAADIAAISQVTTSPIIGLTKRRSPDSDVYITPTYDDAHAVATAGAVIIATDGTARRRPGGQSLRDLVARVHDELGLPVMADVDSVRSAEYSLEVGVDLVASTLSGYTGGPTPSDPDVALVADLVRVCPCPVVAEGRFWTPEQVTAVFDAGCHAVVIGSAVTSPSAITRRFIDGLYRTTRGEGRIIT